MTIEYDPFSEAARKDPFASYKELRDRAPAYWSESTGAWIISRYRDVRRVLTEWELFSSDAMSSAILGIPPVEFWTTRRAGCSVLSARRPPKRRPRP